MSKKLTLKLKPEIIERAKQYARQNNTNLSSLVESYLTTLTRKKKQKYITDALKGCLKEYETKDDHKLKQQYYEHQLTKH